MVQPYIICGVDWVVTYGGNGRAEYRTGKYQIIDPRIYIFIKTSFNSLTLNNYLYFFVCELIKKGQDGAGNSIVKLKIFIFAGSSKCKHKPEASAGNKRYAQ